MKAEKIEKHMRRRTVVRGQDTASTVFGVITEDDGSTSPPLRVEGCLLDGARNVYDYDWFNPHEVRKATDDERAAFFAWLVSDGNDLADGFARFGGAPRGFEEWQTAQEKPVEATPDVPAVGWMFTPPKPAFTVGQRVRLESGGGLPPLLGFTNGGVYTVRKVAPNGSSVELELESGESGFAAADQIEPAPVEPPAPWDEQDPLCTPFQPHDEPKSVEPPAPKHKRGDLRIWLRSDGAAGMARVASVDSDGDVWTVDEAGFKSPDEAHELTRENVAMLVAKQREHGIAPEVGDLVYVMGRSPLGMMGRIAFVVDDMGSEMTLARTADVPLMAARDHLILVIRRNPLRELGDE